MHGILNKEKREEEPWKNLNDIFCYGRTGNTIHIHVVPPDLRLLKEQLGDEAFKKFIKENLANALARLQEVFKRDTTMGEVFAVSPIFYHPDWKENFESLGFDEIQEIIPGTGMDKFIEMFNRNGGKAKRVFFTKMEREQFLENEYGKSEKNATREE